MKPVLFFGGRQCYACDEKPVGVTDRRPQGGAVELGCTRHADPTIKVVAACIYCSGAVRRGSLVIDGDFAHAKCHRENAA